MQRVLIGYSNPGKRSGFHSQLKLPYTLLQECNKTYLISEIIRKGKGNKIKCRYKNLWCSYIYNTVSLLNLKELEMKQEIPMIWEIFPMC